MNPPEDKSNMQIYVEITDQIRSEAASRGLPVIDYIESLITRGRQALQDDLAFSSAIERIRVLRATVAAADETQPKQ
jgi:hypothetical protein